MSESSQSLEREEEQYEVEKILKKKIEKNEKDKMQIFYLVHWKGYSEQQATWEPSQNLQNAISKVHDYEMRIWKNLPIQTDQLNKCKPSSNYSNDLKITPPIREEIQKPLNRLKRVKDKKIKKRKKKSQIISEMEEYQKKYQLPNQQQVSILINNYPNFEIIGAKKSQIIFYLQFPHGEIKPISSSKLQLKNPFKVIQFYEKHIGKQCKPESEKKNEQSKTTA